MKSIILFMLGMTMFLLGCDAVQDHPPDTPRKLVKTLPIGTPVTIAYKETLRNEEEDIALTFDAVNDDSRCPEGVRCIWEGDASIHLTFSQHNSKVEFDLHTNRRFETEKLIFGYTIQLREVLPYPVYGKSYNVEEYSASVVVSKQGTIQK